MDRRRLPTGIQTFREMREDGCYYVDKTGYALRLAEEGKHFFLSRPRRFGKSLFVDTLKELFEGSEALFRGLAVHDRWDWRARHSVVRLSFAQGNYKDLGYLHRTVTRQLANAERRAATRDRHHLADAPDRFAELVETLHESTGRRVAVLVDEYDKPILDALGDRQLAVDNRDYLRGLYGAIKDCDAHIRFSFLTGISKFSKLDLFSAANMFTDLTLDADFSVVCGYTDADLDTVFAPELAGLDRDEIRRWYDGYGWRGRERVYNPYDVLLLFRQREFDDYWYQTGTPKVLADAVADRGLGEVAACLAREISANSLAAFDVDEIGTAALLFQTGYLTIASETRRDGERRGAAARGAETAGRAGGRRLWRAGGLRAVDCGGRSVRTASSHADGQGRALLCSGRGVLLPSSVPGRGGGGREHRRGTERSDAALRGARLRVRVQDAQRRTGGRAGVGAAAGEGVCGEVPAARCPSAPCGGGHRPQRAPGGELPGGSRGSATAPCPARPGIVASRPSARSIWNGRHPQNGNALV